MPALSDLFRFGAAQDINNMRRAISLAGQLNDAQYLPGFIRSVHQRGRVQTDIAVTARLRFFPKIAQQGTTPAGRRFTVADKSGKPMVLAPLTLLCCFAVSSGAADLLIITFQARR